MPSTAKRVFLHAALHAEPMPKAVCQANCQAVQQKHATDGYRCRFQMCSSLVTAGWGYGGNRGMGMARYNQGIPFHSHEPSSSQGCCRCTVKFCSALACIVPVTRKHSDCTSKSHAVTVPPGADHRAQSGAFPRPDYTVMLHLMAAHEASGMLSIF